MNTGAAQPPQPSGTGPRPPAQPGSSSGTGRPPSSGGSQSSGSGQAASPGSQIAGAGAILTFKMKAIKQTERKTLVFDYHRSQAVKREYAPQALFGLLAEDLSGPGHFLEVDMDDEFFRTLDIAVELMAALESFGLRSVAVSLDYGDPSLPRSHRHTDLIFDSRDPGPKQWVVPIGPDFDLGYRPRIEYHFDPAGEWVGEHNELVVDTGRTEDRTLQLDPSEHLGFLEVDVRPERLFAEEVISVEVELEHTSSSGWRTARSFTVAPGSPPQHWRVRTAGPDEREYTVTKTYHLVDGGTVKIEPETSEASTVAVTSPFARQISRRVSFAVAPGTFESAIVDVDYSDPANQYTVTRRANVSLTQGATEVRIGIVDPDIRTTTVQVTLLGPNGAVVQGAPLVGTGEFLTVNGDGSLTEA